MKALALMAALLVAGESPLLAWEQLRLPWVFSDEPDLNADFGFSPGPEGRTAVEVSLGGRFAAFGLPKGAARAPRLIVEAEFLAPGSLEVAATGVTGTVDLADVLKEYGEVFHRKHFAKASAFVYKSEMSVALAPGDYNVALRVHDPVLGIDSHRTLHLIVPALDPGRWAIGDLKFIHAVGKRLDEKGREQRVLDLNPWRQVAGRTHGDLMVAYSDRGQRPGSNLKRKQSIRRLRGEAEPVWRQEDMPPAKRAEQVWILQVPEARVRTWPAGVYVLKVELSAGGQSTEASKTFEVLP